MDDKELDATGPGAEPRAAAPAAAVTLLGGPGVELPGSAAATEDVSPAPRDPRVAAALQRLDSLDQLGVHDHAAVYDAVHRDLRDALADAATGDVSAPA